MPFVSHSWLSTNTNQMNAQNCCLNQTHTLQREERWTFHWQYMKNKKNRNSFCIKKTSHIPTLLGNFLGKMLSYSCLDNQFSIKYRHIGCFGCPNEKVFSLLCQVFRIEWIWRNWSSLYLSDEFDVDSARRLDNFLLADFLFDTNQFRIMMP